MPDPTLFDTVARELDPLLELDVAPATQARTSDPTTSHRAAASVRESSRVVTARLLAAYGSAGPMTAHEAASVAGVDPWAASKRVSDLKRLELVEPTGAERPGPSGRPGQVLRLTPAGRDWLHRNRP